VLAEQQKGTFLWTKSLQLGCCRMLNLLFLAREGEKSATELPFAFIVTSHSLTNWLQSVPTSR